MKKRMTVKTKLTLIGLSSVGVAICLSGAVALGMQESKIRTTVPLTTKTIKAGEKLTANHFTQIEIPPSAISGTNVVTNANDIVGTYALRDLGPGEFLYANWLATDYYERIAEKTIYSALPIAVSQFTSVNTEVKPDDFIRLSVVIGSELNGSYAGSMSQTGVPDNVEIIEPTEFSRLRVLSVLDGSGTDLTNRRDDLLAQQSAAEAEGGGVSLPQASMLILDVTDTQRVMLLQAASLGTLQMSIIPEEEQEKERVIWGISTATESEDGFTLDASNSVGMSNEEEEARKAELEQALEERLEQQLQEQADELGITLEEARAYYEKQLEEERAELERLTVEAEAQRSEEEEIVRNALAEAENNNG